MTFLGDLEPFLACLGDFDIFSFGEVHSMILGEKTRWVSDFVLATSSFCSGLGYAEAPSKFSPQTG
jgi:hypothetical protein